MMSVTTYASQLQTLNNIKRNQSAASELSNQVATQVKSGDLSYYGGLDAGRILNSRQQVSKLEAYNKGIDIVTPELKAYDLQVSRMDELASSVAKALQGQGTYDPADESEIGSIIDTALTELTSLLNEKVGGAICGPVGITTPRRSATWATCPIWPPPIPSRRRPRPSCRITTSRRPAPTRPPGTRRVSRPRRARA